MSKVTLPGAVVYHWAHRESRGPHFKRVPAPQKYTLTSGNTWEHFTVKEDTPLGECMSSDRYRVHVDSSSRFQTKTQTNKQTRLNALPAWLIDVTIYEHVCTCAEDYRLHAANNTGRMHAIQVEQCSPWWVTRWCFNSARLLNVLPHSLHVYTSPTEYFAGLSDLLAAAKRNNNTELPIDLSPTLTVTNWAAL